MYTNDRKCFMVFKLNSVLLFVMNIQLSDINQKKTHVTNRKRSKILIIDDNESMTKLLSRFFEIKNIQYTISNDGYAGLQLINEKKFDTILLDLAMPDFSGWDIIESLEKQGKIKEERILVFTASALSPLQMEELLERGIRGCIKKPVKLESLLQVLEV